MAKSKQTASKTKPIAKIAPQLSESDADSEPELQPIATSSRTAMSNKAPAVDKAAAPSDEEEETASESEEAEPSPKKPSQKKAQVGKKITQSTSGKIVSAAAGPSKQKQTLTTKKAPVVESSESEDDDDAEDVQPGAESEPDMDSEDSIAPQASSTQRIAGPRSMSTKAGLTFPVMKTYKTLKNGGYADIVQKGKNQIHHHAFILIFFSFSGAGVFMTAVLEYLSAEVLELAGEAATQNGRARITPRHVKLAVAQDSELSVLLKDVTFPSSGVAPHIEPVLLPKNTGGGKK